MNDKKTSVRTLTMLALLVAMSIVFSRVLSISTGFVLPTAINVTSDRSLPARLHASSTFFSTSFKLSVTTFLSS